MGQLDRDDALELARAHRPGLEAEMLDQIWSVSGGVPFAVVELARDQ